MKTGRMFLVVAAGVALAPGATVRAAEADQAAPGSPLYDRAVEESIRGLEGRDNVEHGRPPSPGPDYYWCDNCKTYHRRQPAEAQAGPAAHNPAAPAGAEGDVRPPSPGPDYFWCDNCKTYHRRQPAGAQAGAQPGAARPATPAVGVGAARADGRPPPPGPGYYWCNQCGTYHLQPDQAGAAGTAPHGHAPPPERDDSPVGKAFGGEYYYCDQCRTYHRRPAAAPASGEVDVSRIVGGTSNRPNMNPLVGPAGAGP